MVINVFEGARRVSKLVAAIWIIGWIWAAFVVSPSVNVTYKIAGPGEVPIRMMEDCPDDSLTKDEYRVTKSGTKASMTLCFLARTADNGDRVIPFRVDPATRLWWGGEKYSSEVSEYTNRVKASFTFPQADEAWIDSQLWPKLLKELGQGALVAIIGLLFLWAFTWVTGWIVRGFMGIPQGQDQRKKGTDTPPSV